MITSRRKLILSAAGFKQSYWPRFYSLEVYYHSLEIEKVYKHMFDKYRGQSRRHPLWMEPGFILAKKVWLEARECWNKMAGLTDDRLHRMLIAESTGACILHENFALHYGVKFVPGLACFDRELVRTQIPIGQLHECRFDRMAVAYRYFDKIDWDSWQ